MWSSTRWYLPCYSSKIGPIRIPVVPYGLEQKLYRNLEEVKRHGMRVSVRFIYYPYTTTLIRSNNSFDNRGVFPRLFTRWYVFPEHHLYITPFCRVIIGRTLVHYMISRKVVLVTLMFCSASSWRILMRSSGNYIWKSPHRFDKFQMSLLTSPSSYLIFNHHQLNSFQSSVSCTPLWE